MQMPHSGRTHCRPTFAGLHKNSQAAVDERRHDVVELPARGGEGDAVAVVVDVAAAHEVPLAVQSTDQPLENIEQDFVRE